MAKENKRNLGCRKYTVEQMRGALESAGTKSGAAKILQCSTKTITSYMKESPELKESLKVAKDKLLDVAETNLWRNVKKGHPSSIFFTLKTLGKDRGYVERSELTGKNDEPIAIQEIRRTVIDNS